ncbi:MAG: VWA domain-containing protein [Polyangiaceae bacterium]
MRLRLSGLLGTGAIGLLVIVGACGSDRDETQSLTLVPEGGVGRDSGKSDSGNSTVDPVINSDKDSGVTGTDPVPNECATDTQQAQQIPVDLYFMVDSSGSMSDKTDSGSTKWVEVKKALGQFVDDPASAGLGIGLQYFPSRVCADDTECPGTAGGCYFQKACKSSFTTSTLKYCGTDTDCPTSGDCQSLGACLGIFGGLCTASADCGIGICVKPVDGHCKNEYCSASHYGSPAVSYAALPGNASFVKSSLAGHDVGGLTPTAPALQGAVDAAKAQKTANPTHASAVVLVTDGFPTDCAPIDIPGVATIAAGGKNAGVSTYVIGVFTKDEESAAKTNLNQIAAAGGSGTAFVVNTSQNVAQVFGQALTAIRGQALPCEYTLPVPKTGTPDYSKVNVQYTSNGKPTTIYYVANAGACDPTTGGWYYDVDPSGGGKPTKVEICPSTCNGFKSDLTAKVDIVQGCKTVTVVK